MVVANYRPVIAKVNLSYLQYNIRQIKSHLKPKQKLFGVVKADAYGHGAVQIAKTAQKYGVDGFCVALLDEAIELRQHGVTAPILVLGVTDAKYVDVAIAYNVMISVSTLSFLTEALYLIADKPLVIHIACDTGMNRIGIKTAEQLHNIEKFVCDNNNKFIIDGIFTHFATADGENDNYVHMQCERFDQLVNSLHHNVPNVHLANSAMMLWRNQFDSEIVRVGIAMYGLNPSDVVLELPYVLKPVLSLETEIVHVHQLKKGESVSYGAKYIARQDELVGTLPIGYADGWRREYSKVGVYINGCKCDVLGVICMDQMMIRVPRNTTVGTKVELIGKHQTASDIGVSTGTIGYEILCGLSNRIAREYVNE